jgi:hypothetical protein
MAYLFLRRTSDEWWRPMAGGWRPAHPASTRQPPTANANHEQVITT